MMIPQHFEDNWECPDAVPEFGSYIADFATFSAFQDFTSSSFQDFIPHPTFSGFTASLFPDIESQFMETLGMDVICDPISLGAIDPNLIFEQQISNEVIYPEQDLSNAEQDLSNAEQDLSNAEQDLSNAEQDLSNAEQDFIGIGHDHNYSQFRMLTTQVPERVVNDKILEAKINVTSKEPSHINLVSEAEIPPISKGKRPVGRPRKTVTKRSDFQQETIVDTENMIMKRGRGQRAMVSKPLPEKNVLPIRQKGKEKAKKYASVETSPASSIDSLPMYPEPVASTSGYVPKNYNEFVPRKAKETAKQKISQSKGTENTANKKLDHNKKEQGRRRAMKLLFDSLKAIVPGDLLIDQQGKIKKNPSKNAILCGSTTYITYLEKHMKAQSKLIRKNFILKQKLIELKN